MVVIVEGINDYNKIKSVYPALDILMTNGSAVSDEFIKEVKLLSKTRKIVLCLDPDYAGKKIRQTLFEAIPNAQHIFPKRESAISKNKKKIGVEHMKTEDIKAMFANIKIKTNKGKIVKNDLIYFGLIGKPDSRKKREQLGNRLGIGYNNGKQLLKRLNMFNISVKEIERNI